MSTEASPMPSATSIMPVQAIPMAREASVDDLVQNGMRTFLTRLSRSTAGSLQAILDDVIVASTVLLADSGAVWLISSDGVTLDPVAHHDLDPRRRAAFATAFGLRHPTVGEGTVGRVAAAGEPVLVDHVDAAALDGMFPPYRDVLAEYGISSMVAVPLTSRGETIGVLELVRTGARPPFGQVGLARAYELATHAATFVDTARLMEQLRHQAHTLDHVYDAVIGVDPRMRVTSWNSGAARIYGVPAREAIGRPVLDVVPTDLDYDRGAFVPDDDVALSAAFAELMRDGQWAGRVRQQRADGGEVHVDVAVQLVRDLDGRPTGAVAVNRDLTAVLAAQEAVRAQEQTAQSVLDALPNLTAVLDTAGRITAVNQAWRALAARNGATSTTTDIGADYLAVLRRGAGQEPRARDALAGIEGVLTGRLPTFEMDYDVEVPGMDRSFSLTVVPLPGHGAVVSHHDITWRKSLERQLSYRATHDTLTGLPNRLLLHDRIMHALARCARTHCKVGVLFCDLDQFKVLNDTLGHAAGDQVLVAVARRLEHACRTSDSVTRFGGDEFVVVVEDVPDEQVVHLIAGRLLDSLSTPIQIEGSDLWFGVSIGVVISDGALRPTSEHVDALLSDADTAMYRAKEAGRNRVEYFHPSMRDAVANRLELTMSLRHAVARDELRLEYQPQFSCVDDSLLGVEALVRWQHPEKGLVPPGEFIPAAEESGIVVEIGQWVLDEACRQAAVWRYVFREPFTVSVNISPRQLMSRGLVHTVRASLDRHRLDPHRLCLEITEGALVQDPEVAADTLMQLRALGIRIAVDDFGTGYSSLAYLQRFPVDALKIDRSFVARILDTPKTAALVTGIVQLGRALGMDTLAEGIETEAQLRAVAATGCDGFQGFLRARPVSAQDITAMSRSFGP